MGFIVGIFIGFIILKNLDTHTARYKKSSLEKNLPPIDQWVYSVRNDVITIFFKTNPGKYLTIEDRVIRFFNYPEPAIFIFDFESVSRFNKLKSKLIGLVKDSQIKKYKLSKRIAQDPVFGLEYRIENLFYELKNQTTEERVISMKKIYEYMTQYKNISHRQSHHHQLFCNQNLAVYETILSSLLD